MEGWLKDSVSVDWKKKRRNDIFKARTLERALTPPFDHASTVLSPCACGWGAHWVLAGAGWGCLFWGR